MRFLRPLKLLFKELFSFARDKRAWWILPIVAILLLPASLIIAGQVSASFIHIRF